MSRDPDADSEPGREPDPPAGTELRPRRRLVSHLADLARLRLDDEEAELLARDLTTVLAYVERLAAYAEPPTPDSPTSDPPTPEPWEADDAVEPGLPRPVFVANAPSTAEGLLWVPAVHPTVRRRRRRSAEDEATAEGGGGEDGGGEDGGGEGGG